MKKLLAALFFVVGFAVFAAIPGQAPFYKSNLSGTAVLVSGSPVYLAGYNAGNTNAAIVYLQIFDAATAGAVNVGTTPPTMVLAIPGNGVIDGLQTAAVPFQNGIVIAATTTATGSTAPGSAISTTIILK